MNIKPVFIMGCQRSGTTMLASQLGKAKNAIAFPEMQFILNLTSKAYRSNTRPEQAFINLQQNFRFKVAGLHIVERVFVEEYQKKDLSVVITTLVKLNYFNSAAEEITWLEHNPQNRDAVITLIKVFPEAKFIHIYRDPRAIYWSMKSNARWHIGDPLTFSLLWKDAVSKCYLHSNNFRKHFIEIKYEDYVEDPESHLKVLCVFLNMEYSIKMLEGGGVNLPKFTQQQHKFTTKPADISRINQWQYKISDYDRDVIELVCYEWMLHYGYISQERSALKITWKDKLGCYLRSVGATVQSKLVNLYQNKTS
jgi:hypothetical protein